MARLRSADPIADDRVPGELLSTDHPVWREPSLFSEWCQAHGIPQVALSLDLETWAHRFRRASDAWAIANMIVIPGSPAIPDRARLHNLGVPFVGALDRARAQAEGQLRAQGGTGYS